jgi:hypothetical protein
MDNETAVAEPTPEAVDEATALATPVTGAPATDEPQEAAAPTEEPGPAAKAWATAEDEYAVLEVPEVQAVIERDWRRKEERLRSDLEAEYQRRDRVWESTNLHDQVQGALGRVLQTISDNDPDGFERAISRVENMAKPYLEDYRRQLKEEGQSEIMSVVGKVLGAGLDRRSADAYDELWRTPGTTWQQLMEFRDKARIDKSIAPFKERAEKAEAEVEALKVQLRGGKAPPLGEGAPGRGSAINTVAEAERRYGLPLGHPERIDHEQFKSALEALGAKYP